MELWSLAARAGLVGLAALTTCCHQPRPGSSWQAIRVGERERSYLLHVPLTWPPDRRGLTPLVVALHGRAGDGGQMESGSGLSTLADREGFLVAYPDGVHRSWNDRRGESPAARAGADDVRFVGELIDRLVAREQVDPRRVYVVGVSNGGMMAFRLACELAPKIAAVGAVIGLMPADGADRCAPSHAVPVMIIAGTDDPLVPFAGGDIRGEVLSARETRERWATLGGCGPVGPTLLVDRVDDGTRIHRAAHAGCRDGAEVVLLSVEGGGHTWPGGAQYLPRFVIGSVTREIDGAEELWRFFRGHRLPDPSAAAGPVSGGDALPRPSP